MTDLLALGTSGLKAYSRALSTISDNIANSQTAGYARRTVQLEEARPAAGGILYRNSIQPGGVLTSGVNRAVDDWLIQDSRVASSDAGRNTSRLQWMEVTETALDDGDTGVGASITAIFNAADKLSANPSDTALRGEFLQAVSSTAEAFRRTATSLQSASAGVAADAQGKVDTLNANIEALQRVNEGLMRAREGTTNQASLMDERDRLIDDISASIGVTASFDARGVATLKSSGPGAETLLDGSTAASLSVTTAADGRIGFAISPSAAVITPVSGALAGLSDVAGTIADKRTALDSLSNSFATDLNARHQAGFDIAGVAGGALFNLGSGAASITAIAMTTGEVAASDGTVANGNMLALSSLRGAGGAESNWAAMVSQHAQATSAARAQEAASTTRRDGALDARSAVSGVDLDKEAAELLRYQQAYDAAAKTIQIARETMQTIFNIF